MTVPLLHVEGLVVRYRAASPGPPAVDGVTFDVAAGETLGLVGESGCGKSTIAFAIARALPSDASVSGTVDLDGTDVTALSGAGLRRWWRDDVAVVYQEPQSALNPTMRIGRQVAEVFAAQGLDDTQANRRTIELLDSVSMPDPALIARRYPHELSGGQQQRAVIAMALAIRPKLLVLDEPTTGLDATVERGILDLINQLRHELSSAILFITHDFELIERMCDRVAVLRRGTLVEQGAVDEVIGAPRSDYTRELLDCAIPRHRTKGNDPSLNHLDLQRTPMTAHPEIPLLSVVDVAHRYGQVVALDGVTCHIGRGEVVGLVGESGSGKTTLGRVITGLTVPDRGVVRLGPATIPANVRRRTQESRRAIQMVFQSPDTTLNPRHRVREVLQRARHKLGGTSSVDDLAASVRLAREQLDQLTATLSGGQKQRVSIARAIAGEAALVVCDEPVSALDVSVQATILRLLVELQHHRQVSLLFVSHDLSVVSYLSDRIMVMYAGTIVEEGPTEVVLAPPHHPYTAELLAASGHLPIVTNQDGSTAAAAAPDATVTQPTVAGASAQPTRGCPFFERCPLRIEGTCESVPPPIRDLAGGLRVRCHLPFEPSDQHETAA